jgi:hypothetical protein
LTARDLPAPSLFCTLTARSPRICDVLDQCGYPLNATVDADRPVILLTSINGAEFSQRFLSSSGGRHND